MLDEAVVSKEIKIKMNRGRDVKPAPRDCVSGLFNQFQVICTRTSTLYAVLYSWFFKFILGTMSFVVVVSFFATGMTYVLLPVWEDLCSSDRPGQDKCVDAYNPSEFMGFGGSPYWYIAPGVMILYLGCVASNIMAALQGYAAIMCGQYADDIQVGKSNYQPLESNYSPPPHVVVVHSGNGLTQQPIQSGYSSAVPTAAVPAPHTTLNQVTPAPVIARTDANQDVEMQNHQ